MTVLERMALRDVIMSAADPMAAISSIRPYIRPNYVTPPAVIHVCIWLVSALYLKLRRIQLYLRVSKSGDHCIWHVGYEHDHAHIAQPRHRHRLTGHGMSHARRRAARRDVVTCAKKTKVFSQRGPPPRACWRSHLTPSKQASVLGGTPFVAPCAARTLGVLCIAQILTRPPWLRAPPHPHTLPPPSFLCVALHRKFLGTTRRGGLRNENPLGAFAQRFMRAGLKKICLKAARRRHDMTRDKP